MCVKNDFGMLCTPPAEEIDALWKGSIDMHIHIKPDHSVVRRFDALETAAAARQAEQRAVVLKSFFYPTTAVAQAADRLYAPQLRVFGSIVIGNVTTGALDYAAETIETHARLGCRVVWFPAFDAENCRRALGQSGGICILGNGRLKPQVIDVLQVVQKYDMVLCSGHMSFAETQALFAAARQMGITRMVATHPLVNIWPRFTPQQMQRCVELGAYVEHCYVNLLPRAGSYDPRLYVDTIHLLGAGHCILSTDLAQITDTSPAEGMRSWIATLLQFGCTAAEVRQMCQINPARLLDLPCK